MTPALALLVIGGLLLISGWKNIGLADVIQGKDTPLPTGGVPDYEAAVQAGDVAGPPAPDGLHNSTPGVTMFDGHPVSRWIVPVLKWARQRGWTGSVTSGFRTSGEQQAAAQHYGLEHYPSGPQASNHRRINWPGGAVDVTQAAQLGELVPHYPGPGPTLVWGGPVIGDDVHFSANGH